jgi:ABC-type polysaccharide/polyol phosphate transport system ATPase subunit
MVVRLGFAIATAIDPEILLLDEGLGAGDARFADRARKRVEALIARSSIMVLASHSEELIRQMCNRAILLHHGQIIADGSPDEVLSQYADMQSAPQRPAEEAAGGVKVADDAEVAAVVARPATI